MISHFPLFLSFFSCTTTIMNGGSPTRAAATADGPAKKTPHQMGYILGYGIQLGENI